MNHPSGTPAMTEATHRSCTAFSGSRCLARGELGTVALRAKRTLDRARHPQILIFDDATSELIDVDLHGSEAEVAERVARTPRPRGPVTAESRPVEARGPGRPKLGVVAREVTLLPRHWDWLGHQPGGASVALRKLVEEARRANGGKDRIRQARESAYRFMAALAGNEAGFEEATRALFAGRRAAFGDMSASWPKDVKDHAARLAEPSFASGD